MNLRSVALGASTALLGLALVASASQQPAANPGTAPSKSSVGIGIPGTVGKSTGVWELPDPAIFPGFGIIDGFANGLWTVGDGFPLFQMNLALKQDPPNPLLFTPFTTGTLNGTLNSLPLTPGPGGAPFALISGTWTSLTATGEGTFEGFAWRQSPGPLFEFAPIFLIGEIRGRFVDPPGSPLGPDVLGSYVARWKLF